MIRYVLCFLLLTGAAMAKDGNVQAPKRSTQPQTAEEQFWASEQGQWIDQQFQRFQNGEITMEEAMKAYDEKFGAPDLMAQPNPQASPFGSSPPPLGN